MSILAGPRRKQKISADPRNLIWKNDDQKLGQKLMEKMGWSAGRGLGRMEQGISENLKLKANYSSKGLGCDHNYDNTWVEHHDDFADLLANLNKKKKGVLPESNSRQTQSLEQKSRLSKARIHYQKFTRSKDLTRYTEQDKAAVLGTFERSKGSKRKHENFLVAKDPTEEKVETSSLKTVRSELSVNEYFAEKMKRLKTKGCKDGSEAHSDN